MARVSVDKGQETKKHKLSAYMFFIMDLKTSMYVAFGSNMKSEKDAFDRAMMMLSHINTARLDSYYSNPVYVDMFGGKVYIIPKLHTNDE